MTFFSNLLSEAQITARSVADYMGGTGLRLGVTGLSRAGKTVFITSLVHNLTAGGRLPVLRASAEGRITSATLQAQPDDAIPRFTYEDHLASLTLDRHWPESTRRISELRINLEFERQAGWRSRTGSLTLDIIDYPGEWLLDLPLLDKSFAQWSRETLEASAEAGRAGLAADWRGGLQGLRLEDAFSETAARHQAERFTAYLRASKSDRYALSTLPPGRFLMPGELEGSPALTFAPLPVTEGAAYGATTMAGMMERRYEAYKTHVVRPFFRDHFSRLDRQIVLVDALGALNSGPSAVRDLQVALGDVMQSFRAGRASRLASLFRPRIDRILFAATKADHLHHTSHDRLEAILRVLTARAITRAEDVGAKIDVIALAATRATREARVTHDGAQLEAIIGTPLAGERVDGELFDGVAEAAIFPGELPADPRRALRGDALAVPDTEADYRFVRFRPPVAQSGEGGQAKPLPHIRLDRALQFLIGDKLA
ncbi:YcjX family protein [Lichenihabitans sp. Uapishka_5]|nr:YcjX family protein [Lichenihabitans sp. Uapishka_5]MDX7949685.1 YcjX family protein [Lichenihabitans sp. Uapishka_5]